MLVPHFLPFLSVILAKSVRDFEEEEDYYLIGTLDQTNYDEDYGRAEQSNPIKNQIKL